MSPFHQKVKNSFKTQLDFTFKGARHPICLSFFSIQTNLNLTSIQIGGNCNSTSSQIDAFAVIANDAECYFYLNRSTRKFHLKMRKTRVSRSSFTS
jgi:hypothetical protein